MTVCWRICRAAFVRGAFGGRGAADHGGRWNRPGIPVVYTSSSLSLAALEYLVNIETADLPADLVAIPAEIPARIATRRVDAKELPSGWRSLPAPAALQAIGEGWVRKGETAVLLVPSAVIPEENNIVLNPAHPEFVRIRIGKPKPFAFDPRLRRG